MEEIWAWYLGFGPEELKKHLEEYAAKIDVAAKYDARRWPEYGNPDVPERCREILSLIDAKTEWLKGQWGSETAIEGVQSESAVPTDVYTLQGVKVLSGASEEAIRTLPAGLYITPRGKILVR